MASNSGDAAGFFDSVVGVGSSSSSTPKESKAKGKKRNKNKGTPANHHHHNQPHHHHYHHHQHHHHKKGHRSRSPKREPADMTVICHRVDLYDTVKFGEGDEYTPPEHHPPAQLHVAPYHFAPDVSCWVGGGAAAESKGTTVAVVRARSEHCAKPSINKDEVTPLDSVDNSIPNPHDKKLDKYWAQRRRLFSRFDMGIQLDQEGWYSVTPEVIADHVAQRVAALSESSAFRENRRVDGPPGIIILDAFCGCGGNSIAFGKIASDAVSMVVCVDLDRSKLRMAAHNACLYDVPKDKLVFVECNTLFVMEHCYHDGQLQIDLLRQSSNVELPPNVPTEVCGGFLIGGLGMLPSRIDAVFIDPPWGGVDYNALGKNGYCLEKNMRIKVMPSQHRHYEQQQAAAEQAKTAVGDDFFDSFGNTANQQQKQASDDDDGHYMNGVDLLKMAASATKSRLVFYDMPRNTNKLSLGQSALSAGYRGNLKLDEHYLNGRLKTVTAYMGADYSSILS